MAQTSDPSQGNDSIHADLENTADAPAKDKPLDDDSEYPPFKMVLAIFIGMMCVSLLVALDRMIIATAIPIITNQFNSLDDVGWYASSYLLTMAAFQLFMGRVYTFYSIKWVYIASVGVFELGSLICGAAPNSTSFIIGRAIAGIGSAGVFGGAIVVIVAILPLEKRPAWTGMFGAVFAIASVAGPLLGGALTDKVSWRWCFYINLPIGGVVMVIMGLILKLPPQSHQSEKVPWKEQINRLDPIGTAVFIPSTVCFLLALQWGGVSYAWSSARIIVLLVLAGVLFIAFIGVQIWRQEVATVPPRIVKNRSITAGMIFSFMSGSQMMVIVYFLPIWFQAIKGVSAVRSGIMNLPAVLGITVMAMTAGIGTRKSGYFFQWMYCSTILSSVGAGLISTFTPSTGHSKWIGYQVIWGFGLGLGMQQASVAAQTVLAQKDVPTGASIIFFTQTLGGAIFVSVANNVFLNELASGLKSVPGIDGTLVTEVGATDLRHIVSPRDLPAVLDVYNSALRCAFYVGVALSSATIIGTVLMPRTSIKKVAAERKAAAAAAAARSEGKPPTPNSENHIDEKSTEVDAQQIHKQNEVRRAEDV